MRFLGLILAALLWLWAPRPAWADVVQAPVGGAWFSLPGQKALCDAPPSGWTVDASRRRLRPPADKSAAGARADVQVASAGADCAAGKTNELTLIATGPIPRINADSVLLYLDAGRLELQGQGLSSVRVEWKTAQGQARATCPSAESEHAPAAVTGAPGERANSPERAVASERSGEQCALSVGRSLPADTGALGMHWVPAFGQSGAEVVTFDARGRELKPEDTELSVQRIVLTRVFGGSRMLDLASGEGTIQLAHPDAVGGAECPGAQCEVTSAGIRVHGVPLTLKSLTVRVQLVPRVFFSHTTGAVESPSETFEIVRCPMTIASGPIVRNTDDALFLARLDPVCIVDPDALRWTLNDDSATPVRSLQTPEGTYVLLRAGRITDENVVLVASRSVDKSALAVTRTTTWELPVVHTTLLLPSFGEIEFVPKNRDAIVLVTSLPQGRLVTRAVPGAYTVTAVAGETRIRGVPGSSGYTGLRLGYRPDRVPAAFADTDFATVTDPVQRPLREANVPMAVGASTLSKRPVVELVCGMGEGRTERIEPGQTRHVPYSERDSCRLVIHKDRIPEDAGEQLFEINVSVSDVSGADQGDARSSQRLLVRHEAEPEVLWIRGARHQFDRIKIDFSHVADESVYLVNKNRYSESPSGQWVVVTEDATFKFYATAAIPASLYRFSTDPQNLGSGPLSLNFGVLSRLTILDNDGHESLLGLEGGVMGMGLATDKDRQLAVVGGLGVSVPIGNPNQPTQAAVNIHAWMAYSLGTRDGQLLDTMGNVTGTVRLTPWAFVFGPSITVGNVAAFL